MHCMCTGWNSLLLPVRQVPEFPSHTIVLCLTGSKCDHIIQHWTQISHCLTREQMATFFAAYNTPPLPVKRLMKSSRRHALGYFGAGCKQWRQNLCRYEQCDRKSTRYMLVSHLLAQQVDTVQSKGHALRLSQYKQSSSHPCLRVKRRHTHNFAKMVPRPYAVWALAHAVSHSTPKLGSFRWVVGLFAVVHACLEVNGGVVRLEAPIPTQTTHGDEALHPDRARSVR
jgi:hypothetical protein